MFHPTLAHPAVDFKEWENEMVLKSADAILFGYFTIDLQQNKTISTKPLLIKSGENRHAFRIRWVISELANT